MHAAERLRLHSNGLITQMNLILLQCEDKTIVVLMSVCNLMMLLIRQVAWTTPLWYETSASVFSKLFCIISINNEFNIALAITGTNCNILAALAC